MLMGEESEDMIRFSYKAAATGSNAPEGFAQTALILPKSGSAAGAAQSTFKGGEHTYRWGALARKSAPGEITTPNPQLRGRFLGSFRGVSASPGAVLGEFRRH
jgi:hypothetical protein